MRNRSVVFFMVVALVDSVGFGIILPVMPALLQSIGGTGIGGAAAFGGWLAFAYASAQFVCAPIVGALSDRYGRRPVLLASLVAFALDYAIMAIAPTMVFLFVGRLVAGAAGASYSTANAAIADVTPPEQRAKSFGLLGLAFGIGFIIGPLFGGLAGGFGTRAPFILAAALAGLNALYGAIFVPETLSRDRRRAFTWSSATPLQALRDIARERSIRGILAAVFLWQLAFQALPATWAYFTKAALGWNAAAIGASLAFSGFTIAITQGVLVGPIVKRLGERRSATLGLLAGAIGYVWYAVATSGWMLYAGMASWAFGGLVSPACNAMMSVRLGADRQGELQGIVASSASLSTIVAPIAMTQLFGQVGPSSPWLASAVLAAIAVPVLWRSGSAPATAAIGAT